MKLFRCRGCEAHEAHIESLKSQVASLSKLVLPSSTSFSSTLDNLEANVVLNGQQDTIVIDVAKEQQAQDDDTQAELNRVLSGTY